MKQLKTLALFTVLFVVSACSTSGNDTKNNGTDGGAGGNGGGSDAFLTAISKYSKMIEQKPGTIEFDITDGGKLLKSIDAGEASFVKSTSAVDAEYKSLDPSAVSEPNFILKIGSDGITVTVSGGTAGPIPAQFTLTK